MEQVFTNFSLAAFLAALAAGIIKLVDHYYGGYRSRPKVSMSDITMRNPPPPPPRQHILPDESHLEIVAHWSVPEIWRHYNAYQKTLNLMPADVRDDPDRGVALAAYLRKTYDIIKSKERAEIAAGLREITISRQQAVYGTGPQPRGMNRQSYRKPSIKRLRRLNVLVSKRKPIYSKRMALGNLITQLQRIPHADR